MSEDLDEDATWKVLLSAAVVIIGAPSLPVTGGVSGTVLLGMLAAIWGVNWGGEE
jgi:hypothetical protein